MAENHVSHLPHLVGFRLVIVTLKIDLIFHPIPSEDVVAPSNTHLKSEILQQSAKIVEGNIGVRTALNDLAEQFPVITHCLLFYDALPGRTKRSKKGVERRSIDPGCVVRFNYGLDCRFLGLPFIELLTRILYSLSSEGALESYE